ncbi:MAG: SHOCT domain-containing protein [Polaromonas sp.]
MWDNMMGWGGHWGPGWGLFGLMHILWWVFVVLGIVALVRWASGGGPRHLRNADEDRALAILRERYARGEIDKAEFEERKRDLKG